LFRPRERAFKQFKFPRPQCVNNLHLRKTLMAFEKSFTVIFNTDICLYLKVAQCQDDHNKRKLTSYKHK